MSAHLANKYAEKWTYDYTIERLRGIDEISLRDDCLYLGQALDITGLYEDVWRYWRRKWKRCPEIIQIMKRIMQRFEVRLFTKMAKKEIPARAAIFALTHHYGWGKEPDPKAPQQAGDQLDYVDQELIREPHSPEQIAKLNKALEKLQEPVSEPAATPASPPITSEQLPPMEELLARAVPDRELSHKVKAYNRANPTRPMTHPCAYFKGAPHPHLPAIPFEGGFFLRV